MIVIILKMSYHSISKICGPASRNQARWCCLKWFYFYAIIISICIFNFDFFIIFYIFASKCFKFCGKNINNLFLLFLFFIIKVCIYLFLGIFIIIFLISIILTQFNINLLFLDITQNFQNLININSLLLNIFWCWKYMQDIVS